MKKKLLSWALAAAMLLSFAAALPMTASADVTSGVDVAALTQGDALSAQTSYVIRDWDGLVRLSELVRAGTDFSGCRVYLTTDLNAAGKSFSTIGLYSYPYETAVPFNGLFDGQGHTISGLSGVQGLFGCIGKQGVVRNLTVASDLQAESYVGGVAVYNYGLVERCVNTGDISNTDKTSAAGGLVGANYGTVRSCTNSGTISGHKVGGMVGIHPTGAVNPVVEICTNSGTVDGTSSSGGLVGASIVTATVQNCENTGTVKGSGNMGGIVGMAGNTTVRNCANHAEIGGSGDMGGIVGTAVYGSAIYNCYSSGRAEGIGRAGGLVGQKADGILQNCYWLNDISGAPALGMSDAVGFDYNSVQTRNCSAFDFDRALWSPSGTNGVFMGEASSGMIYTELTQALNAWVQAYARQTCFRWEVGTAKSSYPSLLEQAIMPSATPATGGYGGSVSVTLESETQGARIYYTVDGSTPTLTSLAYTGPILISQTTTLKAMAVQTGMENSPVMTEIYTVTGDAGESFSPGMVALRTQDERQIVVRKSLVQNGKISVPGGDTTGLSAADLGKTFADTDGHWSADAVAFVTARNLFLGVSETEFAPDSSMTRGMLVTVMHRLEDEPQGQGESFSDVPAGAYYEDGVRWASGTGLVTGVGDNLFMPESSITREQFVTILYRYAVSQGYDVSQSGDLSGYADASALSDYAREAMQWAVGSGIFFSQTGRLDAREPATRAQVAQMLMNFGICYWAG